MNLNKIMLPVFTAAMIAVQPLASAGTDSLKQTYAELGASKPNAERGRQMWQQEYAGSEPFSQRSCVSCHTRDLTQAGEHVKTGKPIKPLAPSVNPERLVDDRKVEKWFLRNCKWTLGRECSVQEKADFIAYIELVKHI